MQVLGKGVMPLQPNTSQNLPLTFRWYSLFVTGPRSLPVIATLYTKTLFLKLLQSMLLHGLWSLQKLQASRPPFLYDFQRLQRLHKSKATSRWSGSHIRACPVLTQLLQPLKTAQELGVLLCDFWMLQTTQGCSVLPHGLWIKSGSQL